MKKLSGFTLAEVLITIGIIGAVAAMTLPNIKLAYSKKLTLTQLEKTYSTLANTIKMSEYHNGKVKRWKLTDVSAKDIFDKYFKSYMKYALEMPSSELELAEEDRKFINGSSVTTQNDYVRQTYKKSAAENKQGYHVIMMDGSMISFLSLDSALGGSGETVIVTIDTNGESSPNTLGKDIFMFSLSNNAGLIPLGECANGKGPQTSRLCGSDSKNPATNVARSGYLGETGNGSCNRNKRGYWCAALIMLDGWHISKDYPWDKH